MSASTASGVMLFKRMTSALHSEHGMSSSVLSLTIWARYVPMFDIDLVVVVRGFECVELRFDSLDCALFASILASIVSMPSEFPLRHVVCIDGGRVLFRTVQNPSVQFKQLFT